MSKKTPISFTPEFGNVDQITYLQLYPFYRDLEYVEFGGCECPHCEGCQEKCSKCGEPDCRSERSSITTPIGEFTQYICDGCGTKLLPFDEYRKIKHKITELEKTLTQ